MEELGQLGIELLMTSDRVNGTVRTTVYQGVNNVDQYEKYTRVTVVTNIGGDGVPVTSIVVSARVGGKISFHPHKNIRGSSAVNDILRRTLGASEFRAIA